MIDINVNEEQHAKIAQAETIYCRILDSILLSLYDNGEEDYAVGRKELRDAMGMAFRAARQYHVMSNSMVMYALIQASGAMEKFEKEMLNGAKIDHIESQTFNYGIDLIKVKDEVEKEAQASRERIIQLLKDKVISNNQNNSSDEQD